MKLNLSEKSKRVIAMVAPTLGTALGGPLGGMAGQIVAAAVGVDKDDPKAGAKIDEALLVQSPDTLLALRKGEQEFLLKLEELGVERERIAMADRASARDLAKVNMKPQMMISGLFLVGYFLVLILRMSGTLQTDPADVENINTLFSVLTTGVPLILMFWFGSTAGSATKSALLQQSKPAD